MTTTPNESAISRAPNDAYALELQADGEGKAVPMGLEGLPSTNDAGETIHYRRQLIARCGRWTHRGTGEGFEITPQRVDGWKRNAAALAAAGVKPFIPGEHREKFNAADNHGYVERIERDGDDVYAIVALHGDDALKLAAKNGRSIYVIKDAIDASGKVYPGESLHHLALVPNPALPNLGGTLKIAASADGPSREVPVFVLSGSTAAPRRKGSLMTPEIAKQAREKLGLADIPDDQLDDAVAKKALALSADVSTLTTERNTLRTERDAKAGEVLALSASAPKKPDPIVAAMYGDNIAAKRERAVRAGFSEHGAKLIDKILVDAQGSPSILALSACPSSKPLGFEVWDAIEQAMKGNAGIAAAAPAGSSVAEPLALSADDVKKQDEEVKKYREQGEAWKKEQLANRGLT